MKIAICGPEATGKTTLANGLAERLGLEVLADIRGAGADFRGYHTAYECAKVFPYWRELVERQLEREEELEHGVIDVCVLDAWVLFVRWGWNRETPEAVESLARRVQTAVNRYTRLVVMPDQQVAPFMPHRFLNAANAGQIRALTLQAAQAFGVSQVIGLDPGPVDRWVEQIGR